MSDLYVVTVRGTGEPRNSKDTMLAQVTRYLPGIHVDLDYPASISFANQQKSLFGVSGDRSVLLAVEALRKLVQQSAPDARFVLLGYSLGGIVVSKFLEAPELGMLSKVVCAGNIANPLRRTAQSVGRPSKGWGLAGQRRLGPASVPVFEVANPNDFITSALPNSLYRPFVEEILAFSVQNPGPAANKFFWDTFTGRNPVPPAAFFDGRFDQAVADGRGYLSTAHSWDYGLKNWTYNGVRWSGPQLLARLVNETLA